jgi:hypothetical protein
MAHLKLILTAVMLAPTQMLPAIQRANVNKPFVSVSASEYVGIARFSRFVFNEASGTTYRTAQFLTFYPYERILPNVSFAW